MANNLFMRPARQFSFVVEGILPPSVLDDQDAKLFLIGVRNLILTMIAGAVAAVPTDKQAEAITLTPYLGPIDGQGQPRG